MIREITSQNNQTIRLIKKLREKKHRDAENAYLIEGPNLLNEAINNDEDIIAVVINLDSKLQDAEIDLEHPSIKEKVIGVDSKIFKSLSDTITPQGVMAIIRKSWNRKDRGKNRFVILDELQDPGNVGTIVRTADAAGFTGVMAVKGTVDFFSPKVLRAAAGAMFRIDIIELDSKEKALDFAEENHIKLYACDGNANEEYTDVNLTENIGIIVGNEGNGVSDYFKKRCQSIKIPMNEEAESLNVSVAAGIVIYESLRQNRK